MTDFSKTADKQTGLVQHLPFAQDLEEPGRVNSSIAHDFNNILATIMGYTELLQDILASNENVAIHKYLNEIYVCAGRAYDLVGHAINQEKTHNNIPNPD